MKCYFYLSFLLTYLCIANVSQAQTGASPLKHSQDISQKVIGSLRAEFSDVAVGQGLPVLSLDAPDWYAKLNSQSGVKRAWHTARAELAWEHSSGWQLSALARAEASVDASPDAVLLTQLNVRRTEPTNEQMFQIAANSLQWRGQGVRLYSPWLGLSDSSWSV